MNATRHFSGLLLRRILPLATAAVTISAASVICAQQPSGPQAPRQRTPAAAQYQNQNQNAPDQQSNPPAREARGQNAQAGQTDRKAGLAVKSGFL